MTAAACILKSLAAADRRLTPTISDLSPEAGSGEAVHYMSKD